MYIRSVQEMQNVHVTQSKIMLFSHSKIAFNNYLGEQWGCKIIEGGSKYLNLNI